MAVEPPGFSMTAASPVSLMCFAHLFARNNPETEGGAFTLAEEQHHGMADPLALLAIGLQKLPGTRDSLRAGQTAVRRAFRR
jgi:hypothetical protein